ncbi:MAG: (d)CMP kinase [Rhodospirillaceae bacterium]|jgi:CMP/dCMP kinase|nr:(d)CMP kinase [Rhodospirillaceae bacterium]MBT3628675.1 (d)CMP kinase [Rhodospirillaceae bacterium]MBT3928611.1 (d)CMP kinase [Rhodospirillaceae bacterium]MBT4427308.1 (d)CMP kinase [Rhodospirillaceae bacterium]MBT5676394.1 (d)CMP kinase [Rhodospirillaceae bacterium]
MSEAIIIAVDGPAASGKGTLARRLADHFTLRHLDTGGLYRAAAVRLLESGGDPADAATAEAAARNLAENDLKSPHLRDEEVGQAASILSAHPPVRAALLAYQRDFAATPPGAVLDGRDIGTVVCPEATGKIYLEASAETRAARRAKELRLRGVESIESRVLQEMKDRDARDSGRAVAPLKAAEDALTIDTTGLSPDEVFDLALSYIAARVG